MNLPVDLAAMGHITEALSHFNYALDLISHSSSKVDVARTMFDGLNKLQTEWRMNQPNQQMGEVNAFQTMILSGLSSEDKDDFLQSAQIKNLVTLEPKILNHDILRRGGYRSDLSIEPRLMELGSNLDL